MFRLEYKMTKTRKKNFNLKNRTLCFFRWLTRPSVNHGEFLFFYSSDLTNGKAT